MKRLKEEKVKRQIKNFSRREKKEVKGCMMTYSLRNKTIALAMAIIFALSLVMMPVGTAFASDKVDFIGAFRYVETGDNVGAGSVTITYDDDPSPADEVYFKITLPSGVEFVNPPAETGVYRHKHEKVIEPVGVNVYVADSTSTMLQVYAEVGTGGDKWDKNDRIKFDFYDDYTNDLRLEIDDDFRGDLRVNVEVHGFDKGNRIWVESDTITIARVGEREAIVTAEDPEAVSVGQNREAAEITIKESLPDTLKRGYLEFEIRTDGVKFDRETRVEAVHLRVTTDEKLLGEDTVARIYVNQPTTNFAGEIEFTPVLDIDPDVTGEIRIRVSACNVNEDRLDDTTLTVATVGDLEAKIDEVKDNDGVIYAGEKETLDTEFKVVTIGGAEFKRNDMITFELSAGEIKSVKVEEEGSRIDFEKYDDDEAFYVTLRGNSDEIEISELEIKLDPDVEAGDLKLRVGGDYGDLGEVVIARIEKPFTATAKEATEVVRDSAMNRVADIVITEAKEEALDRDTVARAIYLELPEGITFSKEPEVDVTKGDIDLGDTSLIEDDQVLKIEIDENSTEKSTITISDIYYTARTWANFGDVEVKITEEVDGDAFTTVVNAKVVDDRIVTATFTKADDAVVIKEGRTMIRVNVLCDILGLHKSWDPVNRTAYFVRDGRVVAFPIGRNEIKLHGIRVPVDQGAVIINDFTHVPIRHIQKAFGGELYWDDATKTATYVFTIH
ncbi:copper amine oxidase N-terminal domain-containing protein [Peptococcaceae bacterium]|nr:copper amine oxidase N-terminal domain-containing protein [Peptococcaceae bacterium]